MISKLLLKICLKQIKEVILQGSGEEEIIFDYLSPTKKIVQRSHPFEGVIPIMERRYHETDSETVREELAKYLTQPVIATPAAARVYV